MAEASHSEVKLASTPVRAVHKGLVALNNSACYVVAVSWLRALLLTVGVAQIPMVQTEQKRFSLSQAITLWLWTILLTWVLLSIVTKLLDMKLGQERQLQELGQGKHVSKFRYLVFKTAYDFIASAGTYAVMYSWAVVVVGCLDTSTIFRAWACVLLATLFCCALVVAGDKGRGPLSLLHKLREQDKMEHYNHLRFLLTLNIGFVLAFVWEAAADLTLLKLAPEVHGDLWARWVFTLCVLAVCLSLLTVRQVLAVQARQAAARDPSTSHLRTPLLIPASLRNMASPAGEAFQLALDTTTHGLTLVGAVQVSFNVANSFGSIGDDKTMLYAWLGYTLGMTLLFALSTGHLESVLLTKALRMASAAGMSTADVADSLTGAQPDPSPSPSPSPSPAANDPEAALPEGGRPEGAEGQGQQQPAVEGGSLAALAKAMSSKQPSGGQTGLLWYQNHVILPIAEAASARLMSSHQQPPAPDSSVSMRRTSSRLMQGASDGFSNLYRTSRELRDIIMHPADTNNKVAVVANFQFLQKNVESYSVAMVWAVGFAWTNLLSMVLVGAPAQLAPAVEHCWYFAAAATVAAVAVDLAVVELHTLIWRQGFGV